MALLSAQFRSESLQLSVTVNVILPQPTVGQAPFGRKLPVLWLLHGLSDDHTAWQRYTSYEEGPGEHEWGFWDRYIQRVLEWLPLPKV